MSLRCNANNILKDLNVKFYIFFFLIVYDFSFILFALLKHFRMHNVGSNGALTIIKVFIVLIVKI